MKSACTFCNEMNIRVYVQHTKEVCPILAAAYCGNCCCYGLHYTVHCPAKPLRSKPGSIPRESAPAPKPSNAYIIKADEEHMKGYLKLYGVQTKGVKFSDKKLRKTVHECAIQNGFSDGACFI